MSQHGNLDSKICRDMLAIHADLVRSLAVINKEIDRVHAEQETRTKCRDVARDTLLHLRRMLENFDVDLPKWTDESEVDYDLRHPSDR